MQITLRFAMHAAQKRCPQIPCAAKDPKKLAHPIHLTFHLPRKEKCLPF
jgi:hypothetical protein